MEVNSLINLHYRQIFISCIIFVFISIQIPESNTTSTKNGSVCQTPLCKEMANLFISSMNQSVDPCQDFFRYACGNFGKAKKKDRDSAQYFSILKNRTDYRIKEILESRSTPKEDPGLTQAKQLYKACMDVDSIEKRGVSGISEILASLGGWPIISIHMEWIKQENPWQKIDLFYREILGMSPFFTLTVKPDINNSSASVLLITPPADNSHIFIDRFIPQLDADPVVKPSPTLKYRQVIMNAATMILYHNNMMVPWNRILIDATDIVNFELALNNIIHDSMNSNETDINELYEVTTIDNLQRKLNEIKTRTPNGRINLLDYFQRVYTKIPNVKIKESQEIVLVYGEYMTKLMELLDKTPSRVIVNTMHWWLVRSLAPLVNSGLRNIVTPNSIKKKAPPRWRWCLSQYEVMHSVGRTYVRKYFSRESKHYVRNMVKEITMGMRHNLEECEWMDKYSRDGALKKLAFMREFVGYPDWYDENYEKMRTYDKNLEVGGDLLKNTLELRKFAFIQELRSLNRPINRDAWITHPTIVNAFYYYPGNSLTMPAGILQFPFFDYKLPAVVNYAIIGAFIGHEISHGFDNMGSQYDENGNVKDWWSNNTRYAYAQKAQCFVDKFSKYGIEHSNKVNRMDPLRTLNENIADTMGVKALYKAFTIHSMKDPKSTNIKLPGLEHLSSEKILFLAWAHSFCANPALDDLLMLMKLDSHSPAAFRIVGTLSNIDKFSETYKCPKGTVMNPPVKCGMW